MVPRLIIFFFLLLIIVGIFGSILAIIEAFLQLKLLQEQTKYEDEFISLQTNYRAEISKPVWNGTDITSDPTTFRNDAQLADLLAQLCTLAVAIASAPKR